MLLFGAIAVAAVFIVWPTITYYAQFFMVGYTLPLGTIELLAIAPGAVLIVIGVILLILGAVLPGQPQMPTTFPYQQPPFYPQPYAAIPLMLPPMLSPPPTMPSRKPTWCYQCGHLADRAPTGEWYCPRCGIRP